MAPPPGRVLRDNAFIVAAIALPVLVAAFFLVASAVPRWTVPLPSHDLLVKVERPFDSSLPSVGVDFAVRDNRIVAVLRSAPAHTYVQRWALLVVDHATMTAREIPFAVPERLSEGETERVSEVPDFAAARLSTDVSAPDGYVFESRNSRGPGFVGEVFGMRRQRRRDVLANGGRIVPITFPAGLQQPYRTTAFLAWILADGRP